MSSFSPENWHLIPVIPQIGSLIDPYGGRTVESYKEEEPFYVVERDNEICWEAYTSRETVSFSLVQEGLRAVFHDLGVGVRYDSEGVLKAVRVEVLPLLDEMLLKYIDADNENIDMLFGLAGFLDECRNEFVAHLDLSNGQYYIYGVNEESGEKKILVTDKKDCFDNPAVLMITYDDYSFCVTFQRLEDSLMVGIGMMEEKDDGPSLIGNLPNDKEVNKYKVSMLTILLANDCNYITYLDNKNPDRFDRLARRIITD